MITRINPTVLKISLINLGRYNPKGSPGNRKITMPIIKRRIAALLRFSLVPKSTEIGPRSRWNSFMNERSNKQSPYTVITITRVIKVLVEV